MRHWKLPNTNIIDGYFIKSKKVEFAQEVVDCIVESITDTDCNFNQRLARLYLVSDILYNSTAVPKGLALKISLAMKISSLKFKTKILKPLQSFKISPTFWCSFDSNFRKVAQNLFANREPLCRWTISNESLGRSQSVGGLESLYYWYTSQT